MTACVMKEAVPPGLTLSFSGLLVISSSPGVGEGIGVGETEGRGADTQRRDHRPIPADGNRPALHIQVAFLIVTGKSLVFYI